LTLSYIIGYPSPCILSVTLTPALNMKKLTLLLTCSSILLLATGTFGCDTQSSDNKSAENHAVVDSGTYTGTISEVNAEEDEIYVKSDGNTLELYFIDNTKLTKNGESADFSALKKGQKVEVEVKKVGKRLDPLSVKILE
jgi:hypothetical protein